MPGETLQVGDIVESQCRKCNDRTGHAIISIVDGEIAKVECRGCGSVHKHRPQAKSGTKTTSGSKAKKPSAKSKKAAAAKEAQAEQKSEEWRKKMETRDPAEAKSYSMEGEFQANELVDHASFGLGIVQQTIPPNKMDVLFESGEKRLRCAQVPNTPAGTESA